MDVLKPNIHVIDGICYRINPGNYNCNFKNEDLEDPPYYDIDEESCLMDAASDEDPIDIETEDNGRLKTSFHVSKEFFSHIIGRKGATIKRLEGETNAKIIIPRQGNVDLVITGGDKRSVVAATRRVKNLIQSTKQRMNVTHFLSIPLSSDEAKENFNKFKVEVLHECKDSRGVDESIFIESSTLHVTIGVMVLLDEFDRTKAAEVLKDCKNKIVKPLLGAKPLKILLSGLDYMNDDPSDVKVLYAKVSCPDQENTFQSLVDQINLHFMNAGIMKKERERESVYVHCTLMNVKFSDKGVGTKVKSFDATKILEKFKDYYFGQQVVTKIDISALGTRDESGYYKATASINWDQK